MCRPTLRRPWPPELTRTRGWRGPPRPGRLSDVGLGRAPHPLQRVLVQDSLGVRPAQRRAKHPHPGPDRRVRPARRGPRRAHGPQHPRGHLDGAPGRQLVPHEVPDGRPVAGYGRGPPGVLGSDPDPQQLRNGDPGLRAPSGPEQCCLRRPALPGVLRSLPVAANGHRPDGASTADQVRTERNPPSHTPGRRCRSEPAPRIQVMPQARSPRPPSPASQQRRTRCWDRSWDAILHARHGNHCRPPATNHGLRYGATGAGGAPEGIRTPNLQIRIASQLPPQRSPASVPQVTRILHVRSRRLACDGARRRCCQSCCQSIKRLPASMTARWHHRSRAGWTRGVARLRPQQFGPPDQGDGQRLCNLAARIPAGQRCDRRYRGRPELIDHILVSRARVGTAC